MNRILIIGKNGNLGRELTQALAGRNVTTWGHSDFDIINEAEVQTKILELKPDIVFNCTAYTNVDGAETDYAAAESINTTGVGYLAEACNKTEATLVHYSTGMVFSGEDETGYNEDSEPDPVNAYGKSKLAGEKAIQSAAEKFYIIRTAWLYAKPENETSKKSFNEIMLDLAKTKPQLSGVEDEIGSPTWAKDLAQASIGLVDSKSAFGIYHITNSGQASRLDWTKEILKIKEIDIPVEPVLGSSFPRPAKRSHYELLNNTKLTPLRSWQEALQDYLKSN